MFLFTPQIQKGAYLSRQIYLLSFVFVYVILHNSFKFGVYYQIVCTLNTKNNFIFLFLLQCFFIFFNYKYTWGYTLYINLLMFFLINQSVFIIGEVNCNVFDFFFKNQQLNTNLLNGVMLIHPVILYLSYAYTIYTVFIRYFFFKNFKKKIIFKKTNVFIKTCLMLSLSIILGS